MAVPPSNINLVLIAPHVPDLNSLILEETLFSQARLWVLPQEIWYIKGRLWSEREWNQRRDSHGIVTGLGVLLNRPSNLMLRYCLYPSVCICSTAISTFFLPCLYRRAPQHSETENQGCVSCNDRLVPIILPSPKTLNPQNAQAQSPQVPTYQSMQEHPYTGGIDR